MRCRHAATTRDAAGAGARTGGCWPAGTAKTGPRRRPAGRGTGRLVFPSAALATNALLRRRALGAERGTPGLSGRLCARDLARRHAARPVVRDRHPQPDHGEPPAGVDQSAKNRDEILRCIDKLKNNGVARTPTGGAMERKGAGMAGGRAWCRRGSCIGHPCCPACGQNAWTLESTQSETIAYSEGPREEVRTGEVGCACGRQYPVREYVLSLAALFPEDLQREAAFWDRFYLWNLEHGAVGFHDLRRGFAPFIGQGVPRPSRTPIPSTATMSITRWPSIPCCGPGRRCWTSAWGWGGPAIHFARSGYRVRRSIRAWGRCRRPRRMRSRKGCRSNISARRWATSSSSRAASTM